MEMLQQIVTRVDVWIYAAMAVLFLTGIILCLIPVRRNQAALKRATKELSIRRPDGSYLYDSPNFIRSRSLAECWNRFLNNKEIMLKNNAACEVSDFINTRTAIHEPGRSAYGAMLPGLLTTLGILGSFYGIVRGLSTLDLSTTQTMSDSIAVLISGMRTAFNTSIVGAILALIFQIIRRIVIGSAEKTLRIFTRECQSRMMDLLTPDATLMQTLHAILSELRTMNEWRSRH